MAEVNPPLYEEHQLSQWKLSKLIGDPITKGVRGSTGYFIEEVHWKEATPTPFDLSMAKCNFQIYEKGLLMRCFYSNKQVLIPIAFSQMRTIQVNGGQETIPKHFSLMRFLVKSGVSMRYARYASHFRFGRGLGHLKGYKVEPLEIKLTTEFVTFQLTASGYDHTSQLIFFKSLNLGERLKIEYDSKIS